MSSPHDHIVGVIPLAGFESDFKFPWPDCMQPISDNYLAIERSVVECAYAGCDTIWIVCNDDIQPLIRHRLGEYVQDPVWLMRPFQKNAFQNQKPIPIFYVPINPRHRGKIDCYAWSIMQGARMAWFMAHKMSKWIVPRKYYVSYPHGLYPPEILREHRKTIRNKDLFYLSHNGKTFKDGEYLGFAFREEDYKKFLKVIRSGTGIWDPDGFEYGGKNKLLPPGQKNSATKFSLDKVFKDAILEDGNEIEVPWFYPIDNWENLKKFLGSEESNLLARPSKHMLQYKEFNPIGIDNEEE